jgi:DNA-binding transcriptional MocR family regulator
VHDERLPVAVVPSDRTLVTVLYRQIAHRLAERIRAGEFHPGERLPSLRALCREEDVSLMTAVAALSHLETSGLVEAKPRSGFVVRSAGGTRAPAQAPLDLWGDRSKESLSGAAVAEVVNSLSDPNLVPLGAGCPAAAFFPNAHLSRLMREAIRKDEFHSAKYSTAPGSLELRREICHRLNARRCRMTPARILLTAGGMEALAIAIGTVIRPGDHVMIEVPTFFGIHQLLRRLPVHVHEVPNDMRDGFDLALVAKLLTTTEVRAAILMPNFNNPTGTLLANEKKKELAALLAAHDVAIVEDDIYADLGYELRTPSALLTYREKSQAPHYLVGSFSKSVAPGFRIGFIASSDDIFALSLNKFTTNIGNNRLAENAMTEVMKSGLYEKQVRKLASRFEANVRRFRAAILSHFPAGTKVSTPRGGFVVWVELPREIDAIRVHEKSLQEKVSVAPGFIFSNHYRLDHFIRFNAGVVWNATVAQAVATVGKIATKLANESRRKSA